jgi:membrane complex biogenesis BtpA family protein
VHLAVIGPLIGMVHLGPLPGSPGFAGDLDALTAAAVGDASTLADAGFDAVCVENFGDAPYFADDVPKATVAAMTVACRAVRDAVAVPVGVNVLRNDALAALAVAAATGASFIRVNVLSGAMATDQGWITGRAAEVARLRSSLTSGTAVLADVHVKHAVPPPGLRLVDAARDTWERSGADGLILSGTATGLPTALGDLREVRAALGSAVPLYVGSGADTETAAPLLDVADGLIVGTAVKRAGVVTEPVDPDRAARFVAATR